MTFSELKAKARQQTKGNILTLFLISIVIALISTAASFVVVGTLIVIGPLTYGLICNYRDMANGGKADFSNLLIGFKESFVNSLLNSFITGLFIFFWSLLLLVPGIIKSYAYSMSMYIQVDNPNMGPLDCITESRRIMNGNKLKLFLLQLSFIGWILLSIITLGIAFIWVAPYIEATTYNFYLDVKAQKAQA